MSRATEGTMEDGRELDANTWLLERGHNNGGLCQLCWSEAHRRVYEGFDSVTEAYHVVMDEWQARALRTLSPSTETQDG